MSVRIEARMMKTLFFLHIMGMIKQIRGCVLTDFSPTTGSKGNGNSWQVLQDFKMPCNGRIVAYRLNARKTGPVLVTILKDLGGCKFRKVGVNTITALTTGYQVIEIPEDSHIQVTTSHVLGIKNYNESIRVPYIVRVDHPNETSDRVSMTCSSGSYDTAFIMGSFTTVTLSLVGNAGYRAFSIQPYIEELPTGGTVSKTVILKQSCESVDPPTWMDMPAISDDDNQTCSQIPNGTSSMIMRPYQKIRGVTTITLETKETKCVPPFGLRVSVAYCEAYETCEVESMCYSKLETTEGHCRYYCNWRKSVMGNSIIISPYLSTGFKLCRIIIGN